MKHVRRSLTASLVLALLTAPFLAVPAYARGADPFVVRQLDARDSKDVAVTIMRPSGSSIDQLSVTENGSQVEAKMNTLASAGTPVGVVYVIDNSAAASGYLDSIKASIMQILAAKTPNESFSFITSNTSAANVVSGFSTDSSTLASTLSSIQSNGDHALAPGIAQAARELKGSPVLEPNIVVISSSDGAEDPNTYASAVGDARTSGSSVFVVATPTGGDPTSRPTLNELVTSTGGSFTTGHDTVSFQSSMASVAQSLSRQVIVTYASSAKDALSLTISDGTNSTIVHTGLGIMTRGAGVETGLAAAVPGSSFFANPVAQVALAGLALISAGLLVYGILLLLKTNNRALTDALSFYQDDLDDNDPNRFAKLADSQLFRNAINSTTKIAADRGFLEKVEIRLAQADLQLNPGEAIFGTLVAIVLLGTVGLLLLSIIGLIAGLLIATLTPIGVLQFRTAMRRRRFNNQLPATLDLLASTLRAGFSLPQGLQAISEEVGAPMKDEIVRALNEERLGRSVADSLQDIALRTQSEDFEWVVMAIRIQHQVGGNLAELLTSVGQTIRARQQLMREVRALTAEGRLSSIILVGLPPLIAGIILLMNPGYITPMLKSTFGQIIFGAGVVSTIIGWFAMQKIIKIKV